MPIPSWVYQPISEEGDFYFGHGVASEPFENFSKLRTYSRNNARKELAEMMEVSISSSLKKKIKVTRKESEKEVEQLIESKTAVRLKQSRVVAIWLNQANCQLWTRVKISKKVIKESEQAIQNEIITKLLNIQTQLKNVKKEVSDNPKKELANQGIQYTGMNFAETIYRGDVENITLFLKAGMKFSDAIDPSGENFAEIFYRTSLNTFTKVTALAHQYPDSELPLWYLLFNSIWDSNVDKFKIIMVNGGDYEEENTYFHSAYTLLFANLREASSLCLVNTLIANAPYIKKNELKISHKSLIEIKTVLKKLGANSTGTVEISPRFLRSDSSRKTFFDCNKNSFLQWNYPKGKYVRVE